MARRSKIWAAVAGMTDLKALIEDRVLLPVLEPEIASEYGLRPPATLMLFGPPGTGKTSFARAIAGRLGWPFVELLPSKLASATGGLAAELRRAFHELGQLEHIVAFVDEFEELASNRQDRPEMQGVVNLMLAAQRAAFEGFTNAVKHGVRRPLATTDFVAAIKQTTPSLEQETVADFERSASAFARI